MKKEKSLWNKDYVLLLQGSLVSTLGDVLYSICIGYWVFEKTQSTALMGTISSIFLFVSCVLSPFAGSISDRMDRKWILVSMDFARGTMMLGLGILALMGKMSLAMVVLVAFLESICSILFSPAATTIFADVLQPKDLVRGQSIYQGGSSLISLAGKSISGWLVITFGVPLMIMINGISYLLSALTECFIHVPHNTKEEAGVTISSLWFDLKDGFFTIVSTKGLNVLMFNVIFANLFASGIYNLILPFCYEKGMDIVQVGYVSSIISLGGLAGMLFLGMIQIPTNKRHMAMIMGLFGGICFLIGAYVFQEYWLIIGSLFLSFLFNAIGNAIFSASMILAIPREKRGVAFGMFGTMCSIGSMVSTLSYGCLAERYALSMIGIVGSLLGLIPLFVVMCNRDVASIINQQAKE